MTDLELNEKGLKIAINQSRIIDFMATFFLKEGKQFSQPSDNYVAPILVQSEFFNMIKSKYNLDVNYSQFTQQQNFQFFQTEVSLQQIEEFQKNSFYLDCIAKKVNAQFSAKLDFTDYPNYLSWLTAAVENLQQIDGFPQVDFNSERYLLKYSPNDNEVKLMINLFGVDIIRVKDVNKDLQTTESIFAWKFWPFYIVNCVNCIGTFITNVNLQFYFQYIGATASQTTNLTTVFNCTQFFFSVFWLYLSDIIGRKPIEIIITAIYMVTIFILQYATKFQNYQDQITYCTVVKVFMGLAALIAPLGFVVICDLTTAKNRSLGSVMNNLASGLGTFIAQFVNQWLGQAKRFDTTGMTVGSEEYNAVQIDSFKVSINIASAMFIVSLIILVFLFKETNPRVIAKRQMKKLGVVIKEQSTKETQKMPMKQVIHQMIHSKNLIILFFSYFISLIGVVNSGAGATVFTVHAYGFTNASQMKEWNGRATKITLIFGLVLGFVLSRWVVPKTGEIRVLLINQLLTIAESVINFAINLPIPPYWMYITRILSTTPTVMTDALYLQVVSQYATPQSRGQVLGIFQLGNSIGRILSNYLTGQFLNYNLRDTQLINTMFTSVGTLLLAFIVQPLQRNEMDNAEKEQREAKMKSNII